jgi:hypothetical protein
VKENKAAKHPYFKKNKGKGVFLWLNGRIIEKRNEAKIVVHRRNADQEAKMCVCVTSSFVCLKN